MTFNKVISQFKNWISEIFYCIKPGYLPALINNKKGSMTGRKIEGDANDIPNKKLCTEESKQDINVTVQTKIRKKPVALLLGYCGSNYYGMQINKSFKTIEGDLLESLYKANCIPKEAQTQPQIVSFQRAARTDKGVSAARQIVSLKIAENYNIETINSHLPEKIKVFSVERVTKGFDAKNSCVARTYAYTLPTFALDSELHEEYPHNYRITEQTLQRVNEILISFLGSHCFHNFTCKKDSKDPSARRYIMHFKAEQPFVDGEEFLTLIVKGQSFMLYQIRKMVGHVIAVLKGLAPSDINERIWTDEKLGVPTAPALGLVLENLHFDRYNRKFGNDGMHKALTWDAEADTIEAFKKKYILPNIIKTELENKSMFNWLLSLREYRFYGAVNETKEDNLGETLEGENLEEIKEEKLTVKDQLCKNSQPKLDWLIGLQPTDFQLPARKVTTPLNFNVFNMAP